MSTGELMRCNCRKANSRITVRGSTSNGIATALPPDSGHANPDLRRGIVETLAQRFDRVQIRQHRDRMQPQLGVRFYGELHHLRYNLSPRDAPPIHVHAKPSQFSAALEPDVLVPEIEQIRQQAWTRQFAVRTERLQIRDRPRELFIAQGQPSDRVFQVDFQNLKSQFCDVEWHFIDSPVLTEDRKKRA
jgi:hypothetical protein